jgi:predicted phosphodiesterase
MPAALAPVLAEVEQENVDAIVFGGDLFLGPFPAETLELVRSVDAQFVRGNCDREPSDWVVSHLDAEAVEWARSWPSTVEVDGVLYCHATPQSDLPVVTDASPEERFAEALDGVDARLVVSGHTHMQFQRGRWVNAGSIGMPYEDEVAAFWALIVSDQVPGHVPVSDQVTGDTSPRDMSRDLVRFRREAFDVEGAAADVSASVPGDTSPRDMSRDLVRFRQTAFDVEKTAAEVRVSGWPGAEEFVAENLLNAPSRSEATAHFESLV